MKKIVSLGLAAALASGMVFAAEPAANPSVVSFTGSASVEWGVDLDAGKTGFKNSQEAALKVKLFDGGEKATEKNGDIWAELKIKADTKETELKNEAEGAVQFKGAKVDTAKFHLYNFYVGIQSGDTLVGEFKPAVAIRADNAWLGNVGGSLVKDLVKQTDAKIGKKDKYEEIKVIEDGTGKGYISLASLTGDVYYKDGKFYKRTANGDDDNAEANYKVGVKAYDKAFTQGIVAGYDDANLNVAVDFRSLDQGQYTDAYGLAAEVALKDANEWVTGLDVKLGGAVNLSKDYYTDSSKVTADNKDASNKVAKNESKTTLFGYTAQAGYKLAIDDKFYVKPMVGYTGQFANYEEDAYTATAVDGKVVGSVILGWGAQADANAGVPYLDGDSAKKVTPGLSVAAEIPLAVVGTSKPKNGNTSTVTYHDAEIVKIVPSFYLGDLVPNLKAACYSEITIYNEKTEKTESTNSIDYKDGKGKDNTLGLAIAAGVAYDIKADAVTVTPKVGVRYANHMAETKNVFADMGVKGKGNTPSYFNLKVGCDVAGLINNTTFYVNYASANLANDNEYTESTGYKYGAYNVKAGTLNVGTKISF